MDKKTSDEVHVLFKRLQKATEQVNVLKREIDDIHKKLQTINEFEVFRQYLTQSNDSNDLQLCSANVEDSVLDPPSISPPNKKRKQNNNNSNNKENRFQFDNDYVVVYTDGACENNGYKNAKAGIGVWFDDNHPLNLSKPVDGRPTNNTAEIQACINALQIAKDNNVKKLKIITDSQFVINCMTQWIKKWKRNNWCLSKGGEVKNKPDLMKLDELCCSLDVKWEHVRGHVGVKGNEEADRLAREGAVEYKN